MSEKSKLSTKNRMVESRLSGEKDEVDLLELIRTLIKGRKRILTTAIICTLLAFAYAMFSTEVFKAKTLLAPVQEDGLSPSALNQFGDLAFMAGITIPSNSNIEQVLATFETREFLKNFINQRDLLPLIFSDYWDKASKSWTLAEGQKGFVTEDGISPLQNAIFVEKVQSGLIVLSISWEDPIVAAKLANDIVTQLNQQLREKAISYSKKRVVYLEEELAKTALQDMRSVLYNLLESEKQKAMLANVNKDFALEVIDPAVAPQVCERPNRKLIVIFGLVFGVFLGVLLILCSSFLQKLKSSNPQTGTNNV